MLNVAEDVYYVTRDNHQVIGLNQLLTLPAQLTEVELEAIEVMCNRSASAMGHRITYAPLAALEWPSTLHSLPHGLYYIDQNGAVWVISRPERRPDLDGVAMDFAIATDTSGLNNLRRLRNKLASA
jgi:hypothetical protein